MKHLSAGLLLLIGLASPALAQTVNGPIPNAGAYGAYNSSSPTCVNGKGCWLQTDVNGNLKVVSSGGGGGGAVTIADGADVAQGTTTDSPATVPTTGTAATTIALLKALNNTAAASIPAGSAIIGKVGIDQTTPGTTNLVSLSAETTKVIGTVNQGTSPWVISGALTANQSVNVAQFGGVSTATGQVAVSTAPVTATNTALVTALRPDSPGIVTLGQTVKSASVPVAIASDQVGTAGSANTTVTTVQGIAGMTKLLVTPDSVALPANQSVNVAQVNGVTTLTGTGVAGTGTQRVTLSNTDPCMSPDIAKLSAPINITSATTTSLVSVSGSTVVYVCGFAVTINQEATTADTIAFEYGTGAACTSPTLLTGTFGAGGVTAATAPIVVQAGHGGTTIFKSAASNGICALTVGTTPSFQGFLTYVQQ